MNKTLLFAAAMLMAAPYTLAQGAPAPAAAPSPAGQHARAPRPDAGPEGRGFDRRGGHEGPDGGMPPGAWWRNSDIVTKLALTPDQQKRIEDVFTQSRVHLIDLHATLEKEELALEPLMNANPVDQNKALAGISKIADTRAELEKTNAKMLLGIRSVLTADQWTKLREGHRGPARGDDRRPGMGRGPEGQGRGRGERPAAPPAPGAE